MIKYRPDIDGLRFFAVLIVIIYHIRLNLLGINIFKGGFVGVDVFFVISGYLITTIILSEIKNKSFSLIKFFERRARRILPLLLFTSISFLIVGVILLKGESLLHFTKTILSSIFFFSNYFFVLTNFEYGFNPNFANPFIHTWSLSIEEQYYIFFPLIFIFLKKKLNRIKFFLIFVSIISFLICLYGNLHFPKINFFLFSSRIWEILLGSIIAFLPKYNFKSIIINNIITIIGFLLIFFSALTFNDINETFPSWKNIIPTLGTVLIIFFGEVKNFVSKLLSFKLIVFLGKISFSLYLIHMPIIVLIRKTNIIEATILNKILSVGFILLVSISTYFLIESIFRNKKIIKFKQFLVSISFFYLTIIFFSLYIIGKGGNVITLEEKYEKILRTGEVNNSDLIHDCIDQPLENINGEFKFRCSFNEKSQKKIIVIGDSFSSNLAESLIIDYPDYNLAAYITTGCLYLPGYNKFNKWNNQLDPLCNNNNFIKIKKYLLKQKDSIIVFNFRSQVYFNNEFYYPRTEWDYYFKNINNDKIGIDGKDFKEEIKNLDVNNNKVFLIYPTPELAFDPYNEVFNTIRFTDKKNIDDSLKGIGEEYSKYLNRSKKIIELYDSILDDNIIKIDPTDFICKLNYQNYCSVITDQGLIYEDDNHLSLLGTKKLASIIIDKINYYNFFINAGVLKN